MGNYTPNPFMTQPAHLPPLLAANNDKGRFLGRAGYQNDNFRDRGNFSGGNFSGGYGYGRNDFERRGDFSN